MKKINDWCFLCDGGRRFHCTRCGEDVTVTLPMRLSTYAKLMKAFSDAHNNCIKAKS